MERHGRGAAVGATWIFRGGAGRGAAARAAWIFRRRLSVGPGPNVAELVGGMFTREPTGWSGGPAPPKCRRDTQSRRNFDSMFATRPLHRCAQTYMVPAQVTADGSRSAQFEHTFLVTADGYEILTMRENEPRMVWDLAKQQR